MMSKLDSMETMFTKYVAQAKTWLNEERWMQYQEAAATEPTPLRL